MGNRSLDDFGGGDESADSVETQPENEPSDDESDDANAEPSDREQSVETDDGDDAVTDDRDDDAVTDDRDDDAVTDDRDDDAVTDDGDRTPESGEEADDTAGDCGDDPYVDPDEVEPAAATYAWNGEGGVCDACGERSERRWRQEDGLVCPDCKEW